MSKRKEMLERELAKEIAKEKKSGGSASLTSAASVIGIGIIAGVALYAGLKLLSKKMFVNDDWSDGDWEDGDWSEEDLTV